MIKKCVASETCNTKYIEGTKVHNPQHYNTYTVLGCMLALAHAHAYKMHESMELYRSLAKTHADLGEYSSSAYAERYLMPYLTRHSLLSNFRNFRPGKANGGSLLQ